MSKAFAFNVPMMKQGKMWAQQSIWLRETLGPRGELWYARFNHYWFKNESDMLLFRLRWM